MKQKSKRSILDDMAFTNLKKEKENMTEKQFERYLGVLENKNQAVLAVADSINDLSTAVSGMYDGSSKSAFWGMSQALFSMIGESDSTYNKGSLKIEIMKDDK